MYMLQVIAVQDGGQGVSWVCRVQGRGLLCPCLLFTEGRL